MRAYFIIEREFTLSLLGGGALRVGGGGALRVGARWDVGRWGGGGEGREASSHSLCNKIE